MEFIFFFDLCNYYVISMLTDVLRLTHVKEHPATAKQDLGRYHDGESWWNKQSLSNYFREYEYSIIASNIESQDDYYYYYSYLSNTNANYYCTKIVRIYAFRTNVRFL